jgi:hypothetical protein
VLEKEEEIMLRKRKRTNITSIKRIIKIFTVCFTAAMLIPGLRTFFDKRNSLITLLL